MRFEYDAPIQILIVGDGLLLHYQDSELGQSNEWPIFDTPIGSLARSEIGLGTDLPITAVYRRDGVASITLVKPDDPGEGSLTLFFSENPTKLLQWRVADAQGKVTTVTFEDLALNVDLPATLFVWPPADGGGKQSPGSTSKR
jgi:outer membrane lipoprotein-sorting protein